MTIALLSPSSPTVDADSRLSDLVSRVTHFCGEKVIVMPHAGHSIRFLAGTDVDRASDIMSAFMDSNITSIMTIRGGYGSVRLLDKIDYDIIRRNPKPFWGFSDATALQTALYVMADITGYTGFQAGFLQASVSDDLMQSCLSAMRGKQIEQNGLACLTKGVATGVCVGGTLSVLCGLLGTPYWPDMAGKILVLEEVGEEPYVIDRLLTQLRLAGVWDKVVGVALGDFTDCIAKDAADGCVGDVLSEHFDGMDKPVIRIPYGHRTGKMVVPIGKMVMIDADKGIFKEL